MFDHLAEVSTRTDHLNALRDSRHLMGVDLPVRRHRWSPLRLASLVRRNRPVATATAQPVSQTPMSVQPVGQG